MSATTTALATGRTLLSEDLAAGDHHELAAAVAAGAIYFAPSALELITEHLLDALSCDDDDLPAADRAGYLAVARNLGIGVL